MVRGDEVLGRKNGGEGVKDQSEFREYIATHFNRAAMKVFNTRFGKNMTITIEDKLALDVVDIAMKNIQNLSEQEVVKKLSRVLASVIVQQMVEDIKEIANNVATNGVE